MNTSRPPPFWEVGAVPFQELCRDLLREDSAVKECRVYGKNGQGQFGIDLEAPLHAGGCWTGQCKAYEKLTWTDLRDAADEFWKHRARWKERGAKRFIVLAGCGVEDRRVWDQVRVEKERFEREGIEFDLWESRELVSRLRPHRAIVERHCLTWADIICGTASASLTVTSAGSRAGGSAPTLPLVDEISGLRDQRLTDIRELIRAGKELSAERELEEMCRAPSWEALAPKIRARALRQRISLMLGRRQDVTGAQRLLEEAKAFAPGVSLKVPEALIAYHAEGAEAALKILTAASDVDEWNLQLALLLNLGRASEVLKELDAPRFQPDAETWRLRAVAMLSTRNLSGARLAIGKALAINPAWRRLQEAAAVIDYYSALSPAVDAWLNFEWPTPPDWQFVRHDDESLSALRRAATAFEVLASAPEITETERKGLEVWHCATLANDPAHQDEAAALARTLLDREPGHVRIAIWASHRGYEFDRANVRAALERECSGEPATIEPVQALFALLVNENDVAAAGHLLDAHRDFYERRRVLSIWRFERAQAWMALDEKEKARALLAEETDEAERGKLEAALVRVEAARGGSRAAVAEVLARRFEKTKADADLFSACEAHLYGKQPDYVANQARELVRRIGTESALRLALDGSFAAGQYDLCLDLLDQHMNLFPGRNPPPVVHRLRVECLRRCGRLAEAQRAAEVLAREAGEAMDLFAVFETQRAAGDMAAAAMTGRQLLSRPDITPEGLLHLSMHLRIDAPDVAKEAFEEVLKRGVKTAQQAATATQVGFDLGFDDQIGPLIAQAIAAAGQPGAPLVQFSMAEALEMMAERRGAREEDAETYGRGEIPVHLYAQAHQLPLAALYRSSLLLNEKAGLPLGSFATMVRHGSRDQPRSLASGEDIGLFLDVTSYLLAGHLDLLGALEAEFAPIQVSPHLPSSLQEQLAMLANEQVARQPPKAEVLDLVAEQRIAVVEPDEREPEESILKQPMGTRWCALLAHAQKNNGYLIDFLPLRSNDAAMVVVQVPADVELRLRSTGDLVEALKQSGAITAEQYDLALERLGGDGAPSGRGTELKPGSLVVLEGTAAENLAYAGVLRALTDRCRVAFDIAEHRRLLAEAETRRQRMELVGWLRQLRDRLRRGLQTGVYVSKGNVGERPGHADFPKSATGACAWDLLDQGRHAAISTCCDDRFIGRFENVGESRLIDTFDLLHELRRRGRLSADALYSWLARLRGGNARYLPISHEEILHQLGRAEMGANGLVETPELAALRRYVAACVLDTKRLQRPPPNHPRMHDLTEIKCIMTFYSAGSEALMQLWRDESLPEDRLIAASDWLLHQFLFDVGGAVEVWNQGDLPPALAADMAGVSDANLFFRGIALAGKDRSTGKGETSRQKLFVRWLMTRLEPDASRLAQLGRHLREAVLEPVRAAQSEEERLIAALMCGELYMAFPQELQRAVGLKKSDLALLKLNQWQPMVLGEYSFDLRDFFRAAERAFRRGEAALTARVPAGMKFSVRREEPDERVVVVLESKEAKKRLRISDTSLCLVKSDPAKREAGLHAERRWLDVSVADARRIFPRIARVKNLHERMRQYYELRENSLALHFSSLAARFSQHEDVHTGELRPPAPKAILSHLRLPAALPGGGGDLRASLDSAAETLLANEGFEEAFIRIGTLPIALPAAFTNAFAGLESARREKWVQQALDEIKTPIMRLHLAGLLLLGSEEEVRSAVELLCGFASDQGSEHFDAFETVFAWTYREIISSAEADLPEATILAAAWNYAARLHQLLSFYTEQAEIVRSFEDGAKPRPRELLRSRHTIWLDVAGPQMVSRETLAVHGIAALLEGRPLPPELHQKVGDALRKLCFPFAETPTLPALPLLRIRATQLNALGSFLAECRTVILADYIGVDDAQRFSDEQVEADVEAIISRVAEQPNDKDAWSNTIVFLGMHPPPTELRERFRQCLLATDWTAFGNVNETTRQGILLFLTSQAANFAGDEIHDHFRRQLISLACHFATTLKEYSAIEQAGMLLTNCAHFLAISRGAEVAAAGSLVSTLAEISEMWPKAARHIWRLNVALLLRQPAVTFPKLWPLLFRLRATSERLES